MKVNELIDLINQPHLLDLPIRIEKKYSCHDIDTCIIYANGFIGMVSQDILEFLTRK